MYTYVLFYDLFITICRNNGGIELSGNELINMLTLPRRKIIFPVSNDALSQMFRFIFYLRDPFTICKWIAPHSLERAFGTCIVHEGLSHVELEEFGNSFHLRF